MKKIVFMLFLFGSLWSTEIYVVNSGSGTLSRIDLETGNVDNAFCSLGLSANRIALTEDHGYVVNSADNNLQKIDLSSGNTISYIYTGGSTNPYDLTIDAGSCYVTNALSHQVIKIDLDTEEIVDAITVGNNPAGMTIHSNKLFVGNTDYSAGYQDCSVSVIDLVDFTLLATIPVEVNPQFLLNCNDKIHVSCGGDWATIFGKICIIDPESYEVENVLEIGGTPSNLAKANNNKIYLGDGFGSAIYAYDALNYDLIYHSSNPFLPGATMVAADAEYFYTLGGEWGQNFIVRQYDLEENLLAEYTVGLYATDLKIAPEPTVSWENEIVKTPVRLRNYPNPFNPATEIRFQIPDFRERIDTRDLLPWRIEIFNVKGQKVRTLQDNDLNFACTREASSTISIVWDGKDENKMIVCSGIYYYRLTVEDKVIAANKCLLIK